MNKNEVIHESRRGAGSCRARRFGGRGRCERSTPSNAGGVSVLEITMTVPGALGAIEEVARRFGDQWLSRRHSAGRRDGASLHACRRAVYRQSVAQS